MLLSNTTQHLKIIYKHFVFNSCDSDGANLTECVRCHEDIKMELSSGRLTVAYAELTNLPFHIVDRHWHWVTMLDLSHNNIE